MRILVIPHVLSHPVRIREVEIARALSIRHDVTLLTGQSQEAGISPLGKARFHLLALLGSGGESHGDGGGGTLRLRALPRVARNDRWALAFNRAVAQAYLDHGKFDAVISASCGTEHYLKVPEHARYVIDIVDDHVEGARTYGSQRRAREIEDFYAKQLPAASRVLTVSERMQERIWERWKVDSEVVPNGVWIDEFRSRESTGRAKALRRELGLEGRFVFGYIGGIDAYVDDETVNVSFSRLRARHPQASLLWIGPGKFKESAPEGVRYLGAVPVSESAAYISLFNVGLIPKIPNEFTHAMMPIKSVEYGAARIPAIATPLSELARISFPNIRLVDLSVDAWQNAMEEAIVSPAVWDPTWDARIENFSWESAAGRFEEWIG